MMTGAVVVCRLLGREQLYDRVELFYELAKDSPLVEGV